MVVYKNVVFAGASGKLGPSILNALVESGKFNITVLKRKGSDSKLPESIKVVEVDYSSSDDLKAAFQGQDAIISNVRVSAPEAQIQMIDAAIAAGVKRYLPGEFGADINAKTEVLPVVANKKAIRDYLEKKSRESGLTYTLVIPGSFFDWGIQSGFIFDASQYKPRIYDSGDVPFSASTTATIARTVVAVLTHPDDTVNRIIRTRDTLISQNQILHIARKLTPGKTWEPTHVAIDDLVAQSNANVAKGIYDMPTMLNYIFLTQFKAGYGQDFKELDNELLGIKEMTEQEVEAVIKQNLPAQ